MNDAADSQRLIEMGREALRIEARAVAALVERLGADFDKACRMLLACTGRVVVSGMGKSGHIGGKIAATLASTGTPAFFLHPAEASHGDLGMVTKGDVVLAISYSGETAELLTILPLFKRMDARLIAMTGNPQSTLSREVGRAPRRQRSRGGLPAQPRADREHDGGARDGRCARRRAARSIAVSPRPTSRVRTRAARSAAGCSCTCRTSCAAATTCRWCGPETPLTEGLLEMSRKRLGMTAVVDADRQGRRHLHRRRPAACARPARRHPRKHDGRRHDARGALHRPE